MTDFVKIMVPRPLPLVEITRSNTATYAMHAVLVTHIEGLWARMVATDGRALASLRVPCEAPFEGSFLLSVPFLRTVTETDEDPDADPDYSPSWRRPIEVAIDTMTSMSLATMEDGIVVSAPLVVGTFPDVDKFFNGYKDVDHVLTFDARRLAGLQAALTTFVPMGATGSITLHFKPDRSPEDPIKVTSEGGEGFLMPVTKVEPATKVTKG